ncbi:tyrosinase family protein [Pseudonocardia acaciae]|uniref:tyrosinase family protein n=1 Tax=Pseudonocardia acaciae TaxID=551276 RepID=UPI00055EFD2B|nr:tyrosinase family protein [Pseudonocardia acaciae]
MTSRQDLRVRRSLTELQDEYATGNKKPLDDLMRAWKGIKELPPDDPRSFFSLGGLHGEPFRGAGWGTSAYWGGYCNHGNILFPTWHRVYLLKLEDALRSIPGCADVTLPYWDETSDESLRNGVPWALTQESVELDGATIPNPLRSFVFNHPIRDFVNGADPNYSKPKGYETVRYPLSGLVGTPQDREATQRHNAQFPNYDDNVKLLNQNVVAWLTSTVVINGQTVSTSVRTKYLDCLEAPNYTVFSNTTSAAQWNADRADGVLPVMSLESPHNSIHLAVGGFDAAGFDASPIPGANGDMGENDTAGLDPIFYFHHCFVDRVFWLWQRRHGQTDKLDVIGGYPGTNSVDGQGPTPGVVPNSWLTLDSPLDPFRNSLGQPYTSSHCIDIEKQLGYTYGPGSLEEHVERAAARRVAEGQSNKTIEVTGVNRATIRGSFIISAFVTVDGVRHCVGSEAVLSRWSVQGCANCQTHLETKAFIGLNPIREASLADAGYEVEVRTRDGMFGRERFGVQGEPPLRIEVR